MPRKPTRAAHLGIDSDLYDSLLASQGGHCALCPSTPKSRRLHVDHDHRTGEVRGLLCHRCNRGLPTWVGVAWLLRAAVYLGATWEDFRDAAPPPARPKVVPGPPRVEPGTHSVRVDLLSEEALR